MVLTQASAQSPGPETMTPNSLIFLITRSVPAAAASCVMVGGGLLFLKLYCVVVVSGDEVSVVATVRISPLIKE